jgi:hypothetical protein
MPFARAYTRCASLRRMIPTVLMLDPEVVTFTAKVKIVPITSRRMLTQGSSSSTPSCCLERAVRLPQKSDSVIRPSNRYRRWYEPGQ